MEELIPLFFALDHVNYARWAPIHIRDMKSLPDSIAREFQREGHQAHEQENKVVKSAGAAVSLTESPVAFRQVIEAEFLLVFS